MASRLDQLKLATDCATDLYEDEMEGEVGELVMEALEGET